MYYQRLNGYGGVESVEYWWGYIQDKKILPRPSGDFSQNIFESYASFFESNY